MLIPTWPVTIKTELVKDSGYTFIFISSALLGTRKRMRIKGTINEHPFTAHANTWQNDQHIITVNKAMRESMGLEGGERITLVFEPDDSVPNLEIPTDLQDCFKENPKALTFFEQLSYPQRKAYVQWLSEAKKQDTRTARLQKTLSMLLEGKPMSE